MGSHRLHPALLLINLTVGVTMAALGAAVMGKVMGKTEAEEAFRPWWDSLSDYILYGLAMISVVLLPTAMFTASPLWCNACLEGHCGEHDLGENQTRSTDQGWWVNKYCLMNQVDGVVLHLPYFLITATMLLFAVEKVFHKLGQGSIIQNKFFALLVDYEILRSNEGKAGNEVLVVGDELEQSRDLIDLKDRLEESSSFVRSYLGIQIIETVFSFGCFGFLAWELISDTDGIGLSEPNMFCNVHGIMYECSGHPSAFYTVVLFVTCGMFFLYGLISFYSILWSVCPCMQTLKQVVGDTNKEIKLSPDFLFLLNLLVLGSGIAPAITAMTVLEPEVLEAVKPKKTKLGAPVESESMRRGTSSKLVADASLLEENENQTGLTVEIEEPSHGMHANLKKMAKVTYRAELEPKAATTVELLRHSKDKSCRQATFLSLKKGEEYTLTIKTLVNGQPVGKVTEKFNTNKLKNLLVKELSEDEDAKKEEEETPTPKEDIEEVKVEDNGTYLEEIAEKKEEENAEENEDEKKGNEKETGGRPPIDIFEVQRLSKRMRGKDKQASLEVIDEKAKDSASGEATEKQTVENTKDKIALNLDELPKTENLAHLVSARPKRQKSKRATQRQSSVNSTEGSENAEELKEFEEFFPKIDNSKNRG